MSLEQNQKAKESCCCPHALLVPHKPFASSYLSSQVRFSNPTLPFCDPGGRTWVSILAWKCDLPLSPQKVIISEDLGHTTAEKVTHLLLSETRPWLPLSECSFSWILAGAFEQQQCVQCECVCYVCGVSECMRVCGTSECVCACVWYEWECIEWVSVCGVMWMHVWYGCVWICECVLGRGS